MDTLPDISMPPEVKEDLEIIETEDLKSDPFVRAPPIKPQPVASEPKPKRQISEKQKAHLANARKLARERKAQKKKEEAEAKKQDIKEYATQVPMDSKSVKTDPGLPATQAPPQSGTDGFEQFLGYMDKYADMMTAINKEEKRKREEQERKEKELEAKYFKKFQEQQSKKKGTLDNNQNDVMEHQQPVQRIPKKNLDILNPPQPDFGEYSSYF